MTVHVIARGRSHEVAGDGYQVIKGGGVLHRLESGGEFELGHPPICLSGAQQCHHQLSISVEYGLVSSIQGTHITRFSTHTPSLIHHDKGD